jgi:hypothetical protein
MRPIRILILLALTVIVVALMAGISPASAADSSWRARYWNNRDLDGDPVLKRDEEQIDHDWGDGSPGSQVNSDDFSARWTRTVYLSAAGTYRFSATMDDGMRVWIDNALAIDSWTDSQVHTQIADLFMTSGEHEIKVEYYEAGGKAVAKFSWAPIAGLPAPSADFWQGRYFNNMTLTVPPVYTRADPEINFDWKMGSPWPTVNNEQFSARWTRSVTANPGNYQFDVQTDDGMRLWVNGTLLIDQWHVNQAENYSAGTYHPGGPMDLRLDYFENEGAALIKMKVSMSAESSSIQATPQPPQSAPLPEGNTAVVVNARWLNVRATPEGGDNVISVAQGSEIVALLGRHGGWIKVRQANGVEGWVGSTYLATDVDFAALPVLE